MRRMILYLDVGKLEQQLPEEISAYEKLLKDCDKLNKGNCNAVLQKEYLDKEVPKAKELLREIKELTDEVATPVIDNVPHSLVRKGAPFEFIGSASRYLFGTLTAEDGEYFASKIDKIYQNQNQITKILKNQTHLISSAIHDDVHNKLEVHSTKITENKNKINELITTFNKLANIQALHKYNSAMWHYGVSLERSLERYISSAKLFININQN